MPSKELTHEELVEKVAKAINGPFHPVPEGSLFTLDQLRDVRWQQINGAERKLCLASAKAAVDVVLEASADVARKWWHNPTCERPDMAILAASALGEQSDGN